MHKKWEFELTGVTILAVLLVLPVGIAIAVRDNEWTLICVSAAAVALDFRIRRAAPSPNKSPIGADKEL